MALLIGSALAAGCYGVALAVILFGASGTQLSRIHSFSTRSVGGGGRGMSFPCGEGRRLAGENCADSGWFVFLLGFIGLYAAYEVESVYFSLCLFTGYALGVVASANRQKNLLHPLVIYPLFYYPYSTWHTFSSLVNRANDLRYLMLAVDHAYLGLMAFHLACLACLRVWKPRPPSFFIADFRTPLTDKFLLLGSLLVASISIRSILAFDLVSKREILDAQSTGLDLMGVSVWLMTGAVLLALTRWRFGRERLGLIVFVALLFVLGVYLAVGERDFLFRLAMCMAFIYFDHRRKAGLPVLLGILFFAAVAIPWSQDYKAYWIAGQARDSFLENMQLFSGEFYGASRNLYVLLSRGYEPSWSFLVSNIFRGLLPFSSGLGVMNSVAWFHNVYRYEEGMEGISGWGFHIVADGCLMGGPVGVVMTMAFLGVLLCWLYRIKYRSEYWYVFYLLTLSSSIYCIRADLANLLSQTFKVGGAVVLFIYMAGRFNRVGSAHDGHKLRRNMPEKLPHE